jgi:DNA-binding transcriptional ArsR family regulator
LVSKNRLFVLDWEKQFKHVLDDCKELSIGGLAKELKVRPETISRWVNYFELDGLLKSRFDGLERKVSLK